ncbi:MAG: sigma-70 family RNA polymerase sigma factor [Pirellulales bacterium]|nr:sigma-70 family RNA polymerase sigma factor [Pirellulales bacterium]
MTDAELMQAAREHDPDAWQTLCQRYLPLVWRYSCAQLQDIHAAEDVTSEALLAFLKSIHTIDTEPTNISAWLRSVVRHKVADHHRRAFRMRNALPELGQTYQRTDNLPRAEESLEQSETRKSIIEVLEKLPERQRLALEWKYVEGLRVREIAQRLGETEKAVEATLYRARREFRRHYVSVSESASSYIPSSNGTDHNRKIDLPHQ